VSLTVGELNAILSVDDQAMDPGLRRAEQALRASGQSMGDDADRAGENAGERLGDGLVRGADGRLRDARGRFVAAGDQAGESFGDGLADGADEGAGEAVTAVEGRLAKLKMGAAVIGAMVGAALMDAMGQALDQSKITAKLGAQLGTTPAEAQRYGKIAGDLYSSAIVEDFQGAADAIKAVMNAGLLPPDATNRQIKSMSTALSDLSTVLEMDVGEAANAAGIMVRNGLARNAEEAIDMLVQASNVGANRFGDLGETITQSANNLSHFGLTGKQALGVMVQGLDAGAPSAEVFAGALEEMAANAGDGAELFTELGFNGKQMAKDLAGGGPAAGKALDSLMDKLRNMKDPTERSAAMVELFGEEAVAMQGALLAIDPSSASGKLGDFAGAADKAGKTLHDSAGSKVEAFKRGLQQNLVEFLGTQVIPALTTVKGALGHLWDDAGKGGAEGADRIIAFFGIVGQRLVQKAGELAPKMIEGLGRAGQRVAEFIMANPESALKIGLIAAAIVAAIFLLPVLVAASLATAATLMMVGFTQKLISSLHENLPKWSNAFNEWVRSKAAEAPGVFNAVGVAIGGWFSTLWARYIAGPVGRQWNSFLGNVRALPARSSAALGGLGTVLGSVSSSAWSRFESAASARANSFLGWVRGLPGRTAASLGSLGGLLYGHGQQVVQGLWRGISSMGGWLRSNLIGWAKSAIPEPIAKALGIASPSRVTTAQGRWIARGLIEGLTGSSKQVKAAATKLADIVADSLAPGKKRSRALGRISADSKRLLQLASQEEKVAARLKKAQAALADYTKKRDELAASVRQGIIGSANITQGVGPMNAEGILARLQRDRQAAELFAKNIANLQKKGVRHDLIKQIAEAGVEQGAATAAALAAATPAQIKAINKEQHALGVAAGKAGNTTANAMYGAGIAAGQGLVKGLQSQQKQIEQQMLKIAKGMSKAIRKELGIKSPSRVMARIGKYVPQGLVRGIESGRRAVDRSMASLVDTPTPRELDLAAARGTASGPSRVYSPTTTYNLTQREMTLRDLEALQRRQDALARVGRPR
jgi:hypothetical protein